MDLEKYREAYLNREISVKKIAELENSTAKIVYYHLGRLGIKKPRLNEHLEYADAYLNGEMSLYEIAKKLNISHSALARRFNVEGIAKTRAVHGYLPKIKALKKQIKANENIIAYGNEKEEATRINIILKKALRRWENAYAREKSRR